MATKLIITVVVSTINLASTECFGITVSIKKKPKRAKITFVYSELYFKIAVRRVNVGVMNGAI